MEIAEQTSSSGNPAEAKTAPSDRRKAFPDHVLEVFAEERRKEQARQAALPAVRAEGVEALTRLLHVARGHSGQCKYVASFLLGLYNGRRFKFDLTDLRGLDYALFVDCMAVLHMDYQPQVEVHCYFVNGGDIFEQLAKDWNIRDYTRPAKKVSA